MTTSFYITQDGQKSTIDIDIDIFRSSLNEEITLESREDGLYAKVASVELEDPSTQLVIDRELDRIYFLTCVRLRAHMCQRVVSGSYTTSNRVHGKLSNDLEPLNWSDELTLQLKLWAVAVDSTDYLVRTLLFYQIIEISYPDTTDKKNYPAYKDDTKQPAPRTEAKLFRHILSHAGDAKPETEKYLRFLGLPPRLSNLTHQNWHKKLSERLPIVEQQAREILQSKLKSNS